MYRCAECGHVFDEPQMKRETERHGELGAIVAGYFPEVHEWEVCPKCGADRFNTVEPCPTCGEWTDQDYCDDCLQAVTEAVEALERRLGTTWQKTVDLIGEWYERNF